MNLTKSSCSYGAMFYTRISGIPHVILGSEGPEKTWCPFTGQIEKHETSKDCAIREVFEESRGLIELNEVFFDFTWHKKSGGEIGIMLVYVEPDFIEKFNKMDVSKLPNSYSEKSEVRAFELGQVVKIPTFPSTIACIAALKRKIDPNCKIRHFKHNRQLFEQNMQKIYKLQVTEQQKTSKNSFCFLSEESE